MKEYKLKINNNSYNVVIQDVSDDTVLAVVNGKKHIVQIDTIENLTAVTEPVTDSPPLKQESQTLPRKFRYRHRLQVQVPSLLPFPDRSSASP